MNYTAVKLMGMGLLLSSPALTFAADEQQLKELQKLRAENVELRKQLAVNSTDSKTSGTRSLENPSETNVAQVEDAGILDEKSDWFTFAGEKKPWSVNVGTKVWLNEWNTNNKMPTVAGGSIYSIQTHNHQLASQSVEASPIPYASFRYGRFFVTGSHYLKTDFQLDSTTVDLYSNTDATTTNVNITTDGSRSEWDVGGGYYLFKGLSLNAGYKEIDMSLRNHVNGSYKPSNGKGFSGDYLGKNTFYGPTIGLSGSLAIANGFGLYGSYAHGFMTWDYSQLEKNDQNAMEVMREIDKEKRKITRAETSSDADYDLGEIGITWTPPNMQEWVSHLPINTASVFAGYRYQRISYDIRKVGEQLINPAKNSTDVTQGFTAGINLSF